MKSVTDDQNVNSPHEVWQAEVLGQIYESSFEEMTRWIAEGALLPEDKVRRGNLRWLEAGKVPLLIPFFNAKANGTEPPEIQTSKVAVDNVPPPAEIFQPKIFENNNLSINFSAGQNNENFYSAARSNCLIHPEEEVKYICHTCRNSFCRACPKSYGGSVKICPMCGAMCQSVTDTIAKYEKEFQYSRAVTEGFGFSDFGNALAFPFKFKSSLFFGGVMFMFFTLGQSAVAVGGIFMAAAAIFCFMLANMLTFGILANTIDNFSQGKLEANFMPSFDDFSLWDDVVHPFFLSIGAYLSAFGPLILIILVTVYWIISSLAAQMNAVPEDTAKLTYPQQHNEQKVVEQTEQVKRILEDVKKNNPNNFNPETMDEMQSPAMDESEEQVRQAEELIRRTRRDQLESAIGKSPETQRKEYEQMLSGFLSMGAPVFLLAFIAFLWGIFYFPAACAVAGYTRSFVAAINPLVGLDTIKRLGADYAKIWLMMFSLGIFSGIISIILAVVLSPFNMPRMGNLPATAIGSLFTFYFSVVFSCILGYALFKTSDRLYMYKG